MSAMELEANDELLQRVWTDIRTILHGPEKPYCICPQCTTLAHAMRALLREVERAARLEEAEWWVNYYYVDPTKGTGREGEARLAQLRQPGP
jgi:hypothetical protein